MEQPALLALERGSHPLKGGIKGMSSKKELFQLGKSSAGHNNEPPTRNTPEAGA